MSSNKPRLSPVNAAVITIDSGKPATYLCAKAASHQKAVKVSRGQANPTNDPTIIDSNLLIVLMLDNHNIFRINNFSVNIFILSEFSQNVKFCA